MVKEDTVRATATIPRRDFEELERISARDGVSVSWLIRRAVSRYLEDAAGGPRLPLERPR